MNSPNIIFIILDTLRADRVSYKYKNKILTPTIENLSHNSIYFKNCIANYNWTIPSHLSMFTGLYQTQNELLSKEFNVISKRVPLLTEILKDIGYFTICYTENMWIRRRYGFLRGFDLIFEKFKKKFVLHEKDEMPKFIKFIQIIDLKLKKKIKSKKFLKLWKEIKYNIEYFYYRTMHKLFWKSIFFKNNNSIKDLEQFNQELKSKINDKPLYIFFNFMATHNPYIPLKETFKYFSITIKDFKNTKSLFINPLKYIYMLDENAKRLPEKKINTLKKLYNACVLYSDLIIKRIISILKNLGLLENSYIIITSDHGEHLCDGRDHYIWNHGNYQSLYESVIKVPLLIYNTNFNYRVIQNQVELKDLFHTILHLAGIHPEKNNSFNLKKSILYQIDNNSTPKYIFGEHLKTTEMIFKIFKRYRNLVKRKLIPKLNSNIYFLRSDNYKYIRYHIGIDEFYNLSTDPYEQINITDKNNDSFKKMKLYMNDYLKRIKNVNELKNILTEQEKDKLKKNIRKIKIKGI